MTAQAELICGFYQICVVAGSMNVMAAETSHTAAVHDTLNEVIALHPVFVAGAVGEVREVGFA